jgi:hypothetical protein
MSRSWSRRVRGLPPRSTSRSANGVPRDPRRGLPAVATMTLAPGMQRMVQFRFTTHDAGPAGARRVAPARWNAPGFLLASEKPPPNTLAAAGPHQRCPHPRRNRPGLADWRPGAPFLRRVGGAVGGPVGVAQLPERKAQSGTRRSAGGPVGAGARAAAEVVRARLPVAGAAAPAGAAGASPPNSRQAPECPHREDRRALIDVDVPLTAAEDEGKSPGRRAGGSPSHDPGSPSS